VVENTNKEKEILEGAELNIATASEKPRKIARRSTSSSSQKKSIKGVAKSKKADLEETDDPEVRQKRPRPSSRRPNPVRRRSSTNRSPASQSKEANISEGEAAVTTKAKSKYPPLTDEDRVISIPQLELLDRDQLLDLAQLNSTQADYISKDELISRLVKIHGDRGGEIVTTGVLDVASNGYGFLRHGELEHSPTDVYVSESQIRRFALRTGDLIAGQIRSPKNGEKYYGLLKVVEVNSKKPEAARLRPSFDKLTALFPEERFDLEMSGKSLAPRLLNLIAPIGKGQRGLIVSPPKAGKTILLHQIADALTENYPEVQIFAALIGERPEEVTDWKRTVKGATVYASTFDEPVEEHTRVAEIVLARAKRLVEEGSDVVILLDSITRLARAYNLATPSSGRTLSGGMDPIALYPPKNFFGAARNTEEQGTLTIIATCLVETGSRMDDVIYEEFKGTGNMEVHLKRELAEKRIYPAIDIPSSSTRRDERLFDEAEYKSIVTMRRMIGLLADRSSDTAEVTQIIVDRMSKTKNNEEFMASLNDKN
jgi:transcription termination factor Rho